MPNRSSAVAKVVAKRRLPDAPVPSLATARLAAFERYRATAAAALAALDLRPVEALAVSLREAWAGGRQVFVCGNGGSAANAMHLANDLVYGVAGDHGRGIRAQALPANAAVTSCLANDVSYAAVFSKQLETLGGPGDVLIVLSGSGNSPNVVQALRTARALGMTSHAVLGFSGGECLRLADHAIHARVDDMQVAEDLQLAVGHMTARWLRANPPSRPAGRADRTEP